MSTPSRDRVCRALLSRRYSESDRDALANDASASPAVVDELLADGSLVLRRGRFALPLRPAFSQSERQRHLWLGHERATLRTRAQLGLLRAADVDERCRAIDAELAQLEAARDARHAAELVRDEADEAAWRSVRAAAAHGEQP